MPEESKTALLCGDRNWTDRTVVYAWLCKLQDWGYQNIIHGGARGADSVAGELAKQLGLNVIEVKAQWELYGRSAGPIRNRQMLDMKPDIVVAFHDNIKESKGTIDTLRESKRRGIKYVLVNSKDCTAGGKIDEEVQS